LHFCSPNGRQIHRRIAPEQRRPSHHAKRALDLPQAEQFHFCDAADKDRYMEYYHLNYAHPYDLTPTRVSLAARRVAVGC
jgi:hypothetical protein